VVKLHDLTGDVGLQRSEVVVEVRKDVSSHGSLLYERARGKSRSRSPRTGDAGACPEHPLSGFAVVGLGFWTWEVMGPSTSWRSGESPGLRGG
jgi:hypothetical protein